VSLPDARSTWRCSPRCHRGVARLSGPPLRLAAHTRLKLSGGGELSLGAARESFVHAPRAFPPRLTSSRPVRCALTGNSVQPCAPRGRAMAPWRGTAAGLAVQRDGAACRERRVRRQDRDAARREAISTGADAPRLTPLTHPTTLVRYRLPRVAVCRVQATRTHRCPAPAHELVVLTVLLLLLEQAGHHLRRPRALRLDCIGPATHSPASGANRGFSAPPPGRLRLALGPGWRPSTPSFAPLLPQSVVSSRSVPFGTMQPPFFSLSRVWVCRGSVRGCGGCQRTRSPHHGCANACAFVRIRALLTSSPRVSHHSFLF
jgi:hypothetical protein